MVFGVSWRSIRMNSTCRLWQLQFKGLLVIVFIGYHFGCVSGEWSDWVEWSQCSATCNSGIRFRARHCGDGTTCPSAGEIFQQEPCQIRPCVQSIDGHWSNWDQWGSCSATCSQGYKQRNRRCDNPVRQGTGQDCPGSSREYGPCNMGACAAPIDGGWSAFVDGACSTTCGVGVLLSTRTCTNPAPQNGGKDCEGAHLEFKKCDIQPCRADGAWSTWSSYSRCAVICGYGYQHRTRSCSNPPPAGGGLDCVGSAVDRMECSSAACPPDIKTCDKTRLMGAITQSTSCSTSAAAEVALDIQVIQTYCSVTSDTTNWKFGIEIHNNCDLIPLYTPIGAIRAGTAHALKYGVMVDCYRDRIHIATKNCHNDVIVEEHSLNDTTTTYHVILFES